ncbi:MAG: metallophosphoesterase [Planctomycetota bacterium]
MKRTALSLATLAFVAIACSSPDTRPDGKPRVDRGPYIQNTTRHETTVCWRTTAPAPSLVHVTDQSDVTSTTALETEHFVTLANLKEGSSYTYKVDGEDAEHTFKTAPGPDGEFRALVIGDSGEDTKGQMDVAKLMEKESYDLFLHTGDIVYPHGEDENYDSKFFKQYNSMLGSHNFWAAVGNHDRHKPSNGEPYKRLFRQEANNPAKDKYYYSFTWGNAKFVSIESYAMFKKSGPHMAWLEQELASNDRKWLVLMMHVPIYSTGNHGDSAELVTQLVPLIQKYKVALVLQGHDHLYERGEKDGTRYIVTGGGGAGLYPVKQRHPWTAYTESSFHYVSLEFGKQAITGKMVRSNGSVGDTF